MRTYLVIFIVGAVTGLLAYLAFSRAFTTGDQRYVDLSGTAVIRQTQALGRLETAAYSVEKIIEAGTGGSPIAEFLFGDKLLLIARGDVIAGVDLSGLTEEDLAVRDGKLRISLPAPEIFSSALRSGETRVYDRSQGIFSRADKDLESEARAAAETAVREAACDSGILDEARTNARKQLTALFLAAGFSEVTVGIPQGTCGSTSP